MKNGLENKLIDFLSQRCVDVTLLISDDLSDDFTRDIVNIKYQNKFNCKIVERISNCSSARHHFLEIFKNKAGVCLKVMHDLYITHARTWKKRGDVPFIVKRYSLTGDWKLLRKHWQLQKALPHLLFLFAKRCFLVVEASLVFFLQTLKRAKT